MVNFGSDKFEGRNDFVYLSLGVVRVVEPSTNPSENVPLNSTHFSFLISLFLGIYHSSKFQYSYPLHIDGL